MSDENPTPAVKFGSFEIHLGSGKIASTVAQLFSDTLSPLSETLGYIGDRIRIYREENVLRALHGSHRRLGESGANVETPSPSFLIPYLEKVGIGYEHEGLRAHWENLLVSASIQGSAEKTIYIDILSKMTAQDAAAFDDLVMNPVSNIGALTQLPDAASEKRYDEARRVLREAKPKDQVLDICARIVQRVERRGAAVVSVFVWNPSDMDCELSYIRKSVDENEYETVLERLRILGLVDVSEITDFYVGDREFNVTCAFITRVGAEFFYSTHDPEFGVIPNSRKVNKKYPDENFLPPTGDTYHSKDVLAKIKEDTLFLKGCRTL